MIVDFNSVTPALSKAQPNIKYVIEDVLSFFSSETYQDHVKGTVNEKPTLFIFNNMNVLKLKKGETLYKLLGKDSVMEIT